MNHPDKTMKLAVTIRKATMADVSELEELFRNTVLMVNNRDYTDEEVAEWASYGSRPGRMEELVSTLYLIVASDAEGRIVGFSSIRDDGYLHSMFVHKDHQRRGIATALLRHIESYAVEHGIAEIMSEVSITARPFFERNGYSVDYEQHVNVNRLVMTNFKMKKTL